MALNSYAAFLKHTKSLLWGTRIVLLISIILHVVFTVQLNRHNRASRPIEYLRHEPIQASAASRFMMWSGLFLLFYIVFHLLHLHVRRRHQTVQRNKRLCKYGDGVSSLAHLVILYRGNDRAGIPLESRHLQRLPNVGLESSEIQLLAAHLRGRRVDGNRDWIHFHSGRGVAGDGEIK